MTNTIDWNAPHRDGCEMCLGAKGGIPGNENRWNGIVVCDFCSVRLEEANRTTKPANGPSPELAEEAFRIVRYIATEKWCGDRTIGECAELAARLEPVDPDFTALYEAINELPDSKDILENLELNVTDIIAALKSKGFAITRC